MVSQELFPDFQELLKPGSAYVLQNIKVVPHNSEYKVSKIKYMILFVKSTSIKQVERPEIPMNKFVLTSFADIISGVAPRDVLIGMNPHMVNVFSLQHIWGEFVL